MLRKSNKFNLINLPCIKLVKTQLQYVTEYKYLECILTNNLGDNEDVRKTLRGIYARVNILIRRFSHCSKDVKLVLFQTICTNLYCTQLWWDYSKDTLSKTRIAFNNSFILIMGYSRSYSASMMFAENNINNFDTVRRKCIFNFVNRLHLSNNNLIRIIINQHTYTPTPAAIEWGRSLFTGSRATYFA